MAAIDAERFLDNLPAHMATTNVLAVAETDITAGLERIGAPVGELTPHREDSELLLA